MVIVIGPILKDREPPDIFFRHLSNLEFNRLLETTASSQPRAKLPCDKHITSEQKNHRIRTLTTRRIKTECRVKTNRCAFCNMRVQIVRVILIYHITYCCRALSTVVCLYIHIPLLNYMVVLRLSITQPPGMPLPASQLSTPVKDACYPGPGPWFNIKMSSYQYRESHCGDKTVVRSSYLHNGVSYAGKMQSLYWIRALFFVCFHFLV